MNRPILQTCIAFIVLMAGQVQACSVPVFRYALERWQTAPYRAVVFTRGALKAADKAVVDGLQKSAEGVGAALNISVETVDVETAFADGKAKKMARLWAAQKEPALPWTVLMYPESDEELEPFWRGQLTQEVVAMLVDSPTRKEITKRIAAGESAVWMVLLSNDNSKNEAAETLMQNALKRLSREIHLPTDDDSQGGPQVRLRSDMPLKIAFSVLKIKRDDPAEALFVGLLAGMDKKFQEAGQPVVYPVFGRGRLLTGLTGKQLEASSIDDAAYFMTGACSCQVKELNPGVDLPIFYDWEGALNARPVEEPEPAKIPEPVLPVKKAKAVDVAESAPVAFEFDVGPMTVGRWLELAFLGMIALGSFIWVGVKK